MNTGRFLSDPSESDHCVPLSVTNSLAHCCLIVLNDVTLAFEDAKSKLLDVVSVADVDAEERVGVDILKLMFGRDVEIEFWSRYRSTRLVKILK